MTCATPSTCTCPANQVYDACGSACTVTCEERVVPCTLQCVARCECPNDMPYLSDDNMTCIAEDQCPGENACLMI